MSELGVDVAEIDGLARHFIFRTSETIYPQELRTLITTGADDMDGTHGSTDEEMIYHSAGTQSGQYVDDREFRRLIEGAGYVPVRRNSTYDTFPYDWAPPDRELVTT